MGVGLDPRASVLDLPLSTHVSPEAGHGASLDLSFLFHDMKVKIMALSPTRACWA